MSGLSRIAALVVIDIDALTGEIMKFRSARARRDAAEIALAAARAEDAAAAKAYEQAEAELNRVFDDLACGTTES
ncbi:MAG: hypothetical protein FP826_01560 [Sphingomonadales bacterium]|nr:hypothetical protein [Sphingomonadales bacterium]MBU3993750.1 hypothetical protein [Alphaproteobacteria bacterium]